MLSKSLTGEERAWEVISTLSATYDIASALVLAAMRDRASTNTVALRLFIQISLLLVAFCI